VKAPKDASEERTMYPPAIPDVRSQDFNPNPMR
jgi:hypothetical protein